MFEAHYSQPDDFQGLETVTYSWNNTYHRRHKITFQPLRIWFAWGTRNVNQSEVRRVFGSVEFTDNHGKQRYQCVELDAKATIPEALSQAAEMDLD